LPLVLRLFQLIYPNKGRCWDSQQGRKVNKYGANSDLCRGLPSFPFFVAAALNTRQRDHRRHKITNQYWRCSRPRLSELRPWLSTAKPSNVLPRNGRSRFVSSRSDRDGLAILRGNRACASPIPSRLKEASARCPRVKFAGKVRTRAGRRRTSFRCWALHVQPYRTLSRKIQMSFMLMMAHGTVTLISPMW
jgi:hypothetical protein